MAPDFLSFKLNNFIAFKIKVLNWLKQFNTFCVLDSNGYTGRYHRYDLVVAAGAKRFFSSSSHYALADLQTFIDRNNGWLFGHLGYELKQGRSVGNNKSDPLKFPDVFFFEPEILLLFKGDELFIQAGQPALVFDELINTSGTLNRPYSGGIAMTGRLSKAAYLERLKALKNHLQRGDCYEINFCQEFYASSPGADPYLLYADLNRLSPNPFAAFYHFKDQWLICASPERFLQRSGPRLVSQPIKGTLKNNGRANERDVLANSFKDRAENVMVSDLVRNDLSRVCKVGSVKADELFGIYTFPQVHQMISTISGALPATAAFADIMAACFPMGSMTGAPKIKVMELIDTYEQSRRGVFSGAVGYIEPDGNFDFNVVIRSLMYNSANNYLSYQVGSGVTTYSHPEDEWQECLIKAQAMNEILRAH